MQPALGKRAFVPYRLLDPKTIREAKRSLVFTEVSADRVSHIIGNTEGDNHDDYNYDDHEHNEAGTEVTINECREGRTGLSLPRAWAMDKFPDMPWVDRTVFPHHPMNTKGKKIAPRDARQELFFERLMTAAEAPGPQNILANATTGCHAKGTGIRMFDGSVKLVEKIRVGDYVMGPDSRSRKVLRTVSGTQQMYRITPKRGAPSFVVNEDHMLSLVRARSFYGERNSVNRSRQQAGEIVNISVKEYIGKNKHFKHLHKLRQVGVNYGASDVVIDPYVLGAWLGDGLSKTFAICGIDDEVLAYFREYAEHRKCKIRLEQSGKLLTVFTTGMFDDLSFYNLVKNKHIPSNYAVNCEATRLQLLAGLLDTDGHLSGGCFEITQVNKRLAEDIQSLARSLGFRCSMSVKLVNHDPYYRLLISGDVSRIPTKIPRKQAKPRKQKKNHLVTGFNVEPTCIDEFYGFTLNKDHLYLTADYIVHHNSGKTVAGIYMGWQLQTPTLIVVDSNKIARGWLKNFRQFFGQGWTDRNVGRAQQDVCDYEGKAFVITLAQSLARRDYGQDFYRNFGLLVVDEVQVFGGPHFSPILHMFPARVRAHFTAENRGGQFGKLIKTHTGNPRVVSSQEVLKPDAWIITNKMEQSFYAMSDGAILTGLARLEKRNQNLAKLIKKRGHDRGRNVLVLSNRTFQLQTLMKMCIDLGVPAETMGIHAGTYQTDRYVVYYKYAGSDKRNRLTVADSYGKGRTAINQVQRGEYERFSKFPTALYNRLQEGHQVDWELAREQYSPTQTELDNITHSCNIIFATYEIFSKGVDVPRLDMGVEALPSGNVKQPLGRVLRLMEGKAKPEWYAIHDTVDLPDEDGFPQNDKMAGILNEFFNGKTRARVKAIKAAGARIKFE